jgi:pyruvate/2-oxoglutarate dehydrogenase complex dihydrolipoamide dehydrogenase (E3) component
VATGRQPNVEDLGLEHAGVAADARGVRIDDHLRTTNPRIFAVGDCALAWKFTHAADAAARLVIQNALFAGRKRWSRLNMPWCTYTDPEVARVGLTEPEAAERGLDFQCFDQPLAKVDRAILDGEEGFVHFVVRRSDSRILGCTMVSRHAGEMIGAVLVAMNAGMGLRSLGNVILPYPTTGEAIRKAADACNRQRLTPRVKHLLKWWLGPPRT